MGLDFTTGLFVGLALFLLILVPYLVLETRRGKAHGRTWLTWFRPRGHSDVRSDEVLQYTKPDRDEAPQPRH